ncbi:hypothetical protein K505DRAFT_243134 [Melanomma pulvis-pyrius CBS 109.77]|uniref:BTB domain-containing protein n=1 Tax=Melanomma pulvis-pyrius CBS 109.77 TaxID=1314802 RepID=A0A6A6XBW3_9PLEO|nr:hypothetical protein K505DRAFT_243134 [Melanomma pulvis-pyrius CBS 109.77]
MNQPEDVEVVLAHDRHYKFHANVLARNSTLFAGILTEPYAVKLSNKAKNAGITTRWMIELTTLPSSENPAGKLELVELNNMGEPLDGHVGMVLNENGRVPTKVFEYYESIFYAFYNNEININDDDMRGALEDAGEMITIAEYLGCVPLISKPIDVALAKHGQTMYQAIATIPVGWMRLGLQIKSELIFKEALIHLVGNWNRIKNDPEMMSRVRDLPFNVRKLVEEHHEMLVHKSKRLEQALVTAYPGGMLEPSKWHPIKRDEYARDVLVWMALSFYRHWLAQRIVLEQGSTAEDGGFKLYSQIGQAGEAYMDKSVINQFHTRAPMTKKAMNVLENHVLEIKECMKGHVEHHGVLKSLCQLDVYRHPVEYLTCVEVLRQDIPWLHDEETIVQATGSKRGKRPGGNEIVQRNLEAAKRFAEASEITFDAGEEDDEEDEGGWSKRARYE